MDLIAGPYGQCRFCPVIIDLNPAFFNCIRSQSTGLEKTRAPQPFIDTHGGIFIVILISHLQTTVLAVPVYFYPDQQGL